MTTKLKNWERSLKRPRRKQFYIGRYKDLGKVSLSRPGSVRRAACWFICLQALNQTLAFSISIRTCSSTGRMISGTGLKIAARQLDRNPGNKTSALETVGKLSVDAKATNALSIPMHGGMSDELKAKIEAVPKTPDRTNTLPVPERKISLDLA